MLNTVSSKNEKKQVFLSTLKLAVSLLSDEVEVQLCNPLLRANKLWER